MPLSSAPWELLESCKVGEERLELLHELVAAEHDPTSQPDSPPGFHELAVALCCVLSNPTEPSENPIDRQEVRGLFDAGGVACRTSTNKI